MAMDLYNYLMMDFAEVCFKVNDFNIELKDCIKLYELSYRLNELDEDWKNYIPERYHKSEIELTFSCMNTWANLSKIWFHFKALKSTLINSKKRKEDNRLRL